MGTSVPPPGYQPPPSSGAAVPAKPAPPPEAAVPAMGHARVQRMTRSKLLAAGLVLIAAVVAAFVLLGSTTNQVADPIAQAATLSSRSPGYRMNLRMTMNVPELSQPVEATGNAIVDLRDQAVSMSFAIDFSQLPQAAQALGSTTLQLGMILDRGVMYMKLPQAMSQRVPSLGGKQWLKIDLAKAAGLPGLSSLGNNPTMNDPSRMLQYLRAASDGVSNLGHEQVDGVQTTHYRAMLDLDRVAANVPAGEQAFAQRALAQLEQSTNVHQFPIDVWVDAHHLVRRIVMTITVAIPNGRTMQETMTADLSDYGPQPRPPLPPADRVQDLSSLIHVGS